MSVTRTYTVTVVSTGSGNKYFIDGVQQDTLNLAESGTYRFDQSDSSNENHPLRFSTTSDGTHNSGSEYTTGVTTNGTPGNAEAYTQIVVATDAPTLYYYCSNHPNMGGQANTPAVNTWGALGWNANRWGAADAITSGWGGDTWNLGGSWGQINDEVVILSGQSVTTTLGDLTTFPEQGWGRDSWGNEPYGDSFSPVVSVDGFSITTSLGDAVAFPESGWGSDTWNFESWGFNGSIIVPTGQSITTSVGELTAFPESGWGGDTWGFEAWGFNGVVQVLDGQEITSNLSANGWSNASYGENGWGMFTLNPADVMGLTGVQINSAVPPQFDIPEQVVGVGATSSVGSVSLAQMLVGLSGQSGTFSVGSTTFDLTSVISPTGIAATPQLGELIAGIVEFVPTTGVGATSAIGSISLDQMTVSFSGVTSTSSTGALTPADVMGLTGVSSTASVAGFGVSTGFGIQAYQAIDTGSNTTYSDVA